MKEARVIVTEANGGLMGILVDKINGVADIEEEAVQPPIATINPACAEYTRGQIQVGRDILVFLDLTKLLHCREIDTLIKGGK